MDELEQRDLNQKLAALRMQHGDLDASISALLSIGTTDQIMMMRLKKQKLRLRDEIQMIEDRLIPDIIA
ncbi:MAG: YdcH family protein [Sphingomonadaceae bacterium]